MASVISVVHLGLLMMRDFLALGRSATSVLPSPPESQGESTTSVCYRSPPVVGAHGSDSGRPAGGGVVQGNHDNGRVLVRVGCDNDGQSSERHLETRSSSGSHKPPRTLGSVPCSKTLPAIYPRPPCLGKDRQFHCSGIRQPAGRHSLTETKRVSSRNYLVEQHQTPVPSGDACTGCPEQRSRSYAQRKPPVRGMDSSSTGCWTNMAEIRLGSRRSLRLAGKHSVPAVFLPVRRKGSPRGRCAGPSVAKRAAICLPPSQPDLPHPSQGERTESVANPNSAAVAGYTVASGGFLRTGATRGTPFHISVPWWTYCVSYRDYWKRVRPFPRLKCTFPGPWSLCGIYRWCWMPSLITLLSRWRRWG
ncbi:uncharacterized protein LOC115533197 [Gadus morhua]|uniref:uncharacterized protein LOC115533197 n=1 Tax=Gadus morhua TaxID=8049 RepID=UPI0011B55F53|nr:uncharacterized protein LOC115533197 [Gadus morhua]